MTKNDQKYQKGPKKYHFGCPYLVPTPYYDLSRPKIWMEGLRRVWSFCQNVNFYKKWPKMINLGPKIKFTVKWVRCHFGAFFTPSRSQIRTKNVPSILGFWDPFWPFWTLFWPFWTQTGVKMRVLFGGTFHIEGQNDYLVARPIEDLKNLSNGVKIWPQDLMRRSQNGVKNGGLVNGHFACATVIAMRGLGNLDRSSNHIRGGIEKR